MKTELKTIRFFIKDDYYVDVIPSAKDTDVVELWLHKADVENVIFMFGITEEDFKNNEQHFVDQAQSYIHLL